MANMFRCTLASGGAWILTVTCDSVFAGQTITCTDGTTTLTQICPSTSPYTVEFRIPNAGTWTISSGTESTSVVIPDAIEFHYIPIGSTATPTDSIQTWLHCAEIWDKNYTTISQVLSDASTLQALIASTNAVDYMARSTTWASDVTANQSAMTYIGLNDYCAESLLSDSTWCSAICDSTYFENVLNVKVPTMTSNTTPSGKASGSSNAPTFDYYFAFRNSTGGWATTNYNGAYIQYMFPQAIRLFKFSYWLLASVASGATLNNLTLTLKASNDGTNWTTLKTISHSSSNTTTKQSFNFDGSDEYKYYRLVYSSYVYKTFDNNYYAFCHELQFYSRA